MSDSPSHKGEVNVISTKSHSIKRKRDDDLELIEKKQKHSDSNLDNINIPSKIKSTCGLSGLPAELLEMIFQNLSIEQVFILGLLSQYLWNVTRMYLLTQYASSYGTWAGKSIICVGHYMESTDYPPNMLTESEEMELQEGLNEGENWDNEYSECSDDGATDFVSKPINLYSLARARYQPIGEWPSVLGSRLKAHAMEVGVWHGLSEFCKSRIWDELLRYRSSDFFPKDQPWILRNLTTQEYVRSEAIAIKPEYIHGPNIDVLGFGKSSGHVFAGPRKVAQTTFKLSCAVAHGQGIVSISPLLTDTVRAS